MEENEDHPVLCSFFLQLLWLESLQAMSGSSRSEFFICVAYQQNMHQNSSVDIEFYEEFVLPCSHVAFCIFYAVHVLKVMES